LAPQRSAPAFFFPACRKPTLIHQTSFIAFSTDALFSRSQARDLPGIFVPVSSANVVFTPPDLLGRRLFQGNSGIMAFAE
jgi:hypothetical protein